MPPRGPVVQRTGFDDTKRTEEEGLIQPVTHENPLPTTQGGEAVHTNALLANLCEIGERILEQLHEITGLDT